MALFKDTVCDLLLGNVKSDPDLDVRLFSLIALEKFALTGASLFLKLTFLYFGFDAMRTSF